MRLSFLKVRSDGPYAPDTASMGQVPSVIPDVPICAVLMAFYIGFAATNMTIFQINRRRGHKFIPSGALFGFSMARITTLVLRIVWTTRQHNVRLAIAATIFVNAGILIVYVINLILAERILRAKQPRLGWHPIVRITDKMLYVLVAGALIMVITAMVVSLYTLDPRILRQCRDAELAAITYLFVFTCIPLFHILLAVMLPRSHEEESFGQGSIAVKIFIVTVSSCLCITMSGFKTGVFWSPLRPIVDPAWFDSKAAFFVFCFALEILTLFLLTLSRIDKRFYVPNGSAKPGDYSGSARSLSAEIAEDVSVRVKDEQ